jgi:hypothetical protein
LRQVARTVLTWAGTTSGAAQGVAVSRVSRWFGSQETTSVRPVRRAKLLVSAKADEEEEEKRSADVTFSSAAFLGHPGGNTAMHTHFVIVVDVIQLVLALI